jgi:hypothetical protein
MFEAGHKKRLISGDQTMLDERISSIPLSYIKLNCNLSSLKSLSVSMSVIIKFSLGITAPASCISGG